MSTTERTATATTSVLKVGGANLVKPQYVDRLASYVEELRETGTRVVVVHGGGIEIAALHDALELPYREIDGLRVTSQPTLEIATQVLCGSVNKRIIARFVQRSLPALGLSGVDLGLLHAQLVDPKRFGRVGEIVAVDTDVLDDMLDRGLVLVLAPVSLGPDGDTVNVSADSAARAVASALGADHLDIVTDVAGVRPDPTDEAIVERLPVAAARVMLDDTTVVRADLRPKLEAAIAAVENGVGRVRVGTLAGMSSAYATEIVA